MPNNKSRRYYGLTKEFYEIFWEEIKIPLFNGIISKCRTKDITKANCNKIYRKKG